MIERTEEELLLNSILGISDSIHNSIEEFVKEIKILLTDIPQSIRETELFKKVKSIKKAPRLEDVIWIIDDFDLSLTEDIGSLCSSDNTNNQYLSYIMDIYRIEQTIQSREKLTLVLAHFEGFIYRQLGIVKDRGIKENIEKLVDNNNEFTTSNINYLYVLAIIKVVYANLKDASYIDHRLPFRNDILHNGVVDISINDADIALKVLGAFITIIVIITHY